MVQPSDPRLSVLLALRLESFAPVPVVASATDLAESDVGALLGVFEGDGLVRYRDGRRSGWSLTAEGRTEGERLLADEIDRLGVRDEVQVSYQRFLAENPVMLQLCTDWQLRTDVGDPEPVLNQHDDPDYDRAVVDRLDQLHERSQEIWQRLARVLGRFMPYDRRFEHAVERVAAGEHDWFTKPSIDSYHTVWFELHENLLATLGIERSSEQVGERSSEQETARSSEQGTARSSEQVGS
jgi:hypothetical protein